MWQRSAPNARNLVSISRSNSCNLSVFGHQITFLCCQLMPSRLWDFVSELASGFNPKIDGVTDILHGLYLRIAMGHTTRQIRNLGDKDIVIVIPIDSDSIFWSVAVFHRSYFLNIWRICLT